MTPRSSRRMPPTRARTTTTACSDAAARQAGHQAQAHEDHELLQAVRVRGDQVLLDPRAHRRPGVQSPQTRSTTSTSGAARASTANARSRSARRTRRSRRASRSSTCMTGSSRPRSRCSTSRRRRRRNASGSRRSWGVARDSRGDNARTPPSTAWCRAPRRTSTSASWSRSTTDGRSSGSRCG
jgi:hypothetical protein